MVGEDLEKVSQGEEMGKWKKGGRDRDGKGSLTSPWLIYPPEPAPAAEQRYASRVPQGATLRGSPSYYARREFVRVRRDRGRA